MSAPTATFDIGDTVYHRSFGEGRIIGPSPSGKGLTVNFNAAGERYVLPTFLFAEPHAAKRSIRSVRKGEVRQAAGKLVDLSEDRPYVPRPELIRDTLPRTGVAFIGGQSGSFKTFFCIHAATCLGTGEPLAGRKIDRVGGVVYVAAEGEGTIEGRVKARRSALPDASVRLPLLVLSGLGPLNSPAAYDSLEARLIEAKEIFQQRHGLPLVAFIIDTVDAAGMIAEDKENDPGAWRKVFDALKAISERLDALAMPVHHAGKSASAGLRGSSGIRAGADAVLMLSCDRDEVTGETKNHFLSISKSRDASEGPIGQIHHRPVVIGQREDGSDVTSLVLEIDTGTKLKNVALAKSTQSLKVFNEAVTEALAGQSERVRVHGDANAPQVIAVRMGHVRDAFERRYTTGESDDKKRRDNIRNQFKRGFQAAQASRMILAGTWSETEWVWRPEGNLAGLYYGAAGDDDGE